MVLVGVQGEALKSCPASTCGDDVAGEPLEFGGGRRELRRSSDYDTTAGASEARRAFGAKRVRTARDLLAAVAKVDLEATGGTF